ncbi:hypothetical protein EYZ11_001260 [Aspergillus tanneri]|uniref:Tetraspanin Tsp3 n=1 Tax=Aspergillus tanneri TaxID=1220188 RepID=A0A4S3JV34_9EURO|nr:uncharacterized protein ATNIH1004_007172 [Aspergillus tanneri]KAA8645753.1 hypothetical protein ATNIH1004_007172 [Aspergillus tanneri]THC99261.1 hypothetical protein EYZ11_001260 [Aspergillus tanneri]
MAFIFHTAPLLHSLTLLFSILALIFGALSWSLTSSLLLPLPAWIPATTTLLAPITITALTTIHNLTKHHSSRTTGFIPNTIQRFGFLIDQLHSILTTILATLALTYLFPESILTCHLDEQWQTLFHARDAHAILSIQETFRCCGLRSTHDRAWPFKDRDHGDDACERQLGFHRSCFIPWKEKQRSVAWMVFIAAVLLWGVKIGYIQIFRRRTSWMNARSSGGSVNYQTITHQEVQDEDVENGGDEESRTALLPHTASEYTDNE